MTNKSELRKLSESDAAKAPHDIIKLLITDHELMRSLMDKMKSQKASDDDVIETFKELVRVVESHVEAEEKSFLSLIKDNPKFHDEVLEGYEEHRVHENVIAKIDDVKDKERRAQQMKIYCEMLEHHLKEEEEDLFPKFKDYAALDTRKKIGQNFLDEREGSEELNPKRAKKKVV